MKNLTKYLWIGYTAARSSLAYPYEVLVRTCFITVILYIFMRLWTLVYATAESASVGGLTFAQMLWYLVVTEAIYMSSPRVWAEVDQDVRTGRLAVQLVYPISYTLAHLSRSIGERLVRFSMNFGIGAVVALVLVGPIPIRVSGLAMFMLALPAAFLLDFLGMFLVGLCAFWLENTSGLALIYSRIVGMLGGVFLPIEIYPPKWQPVLRILPFAGMLSAPARMFVSPNVVLLRDVVVLQGAALLIYAAVVATVQRVALRRLFANGG